MALADLTRNRENAMKKWALVLISAITSTSPTLAQQTGGTAPFDLSWGEPVEEVTARYGPLKHVDPPEYRPDLESFLITNWSGGSFLPEAVSVQVNFLRDGGLESLELTTATFDDDDEGTEARRLFAALVDELTAAWGEFNVFEPPRDGPWAAADQFYQCALDNRFYGGCGNLSASYMPENCIGTVVALSFVPEQRRVGHFKLVYVDPSATDCQQ